MPTNDLSEEAPYFRTSETASKVFQTPSLHEGYDIFKYSKLSMSCPLDFFVRLLVLNL